MPGHRSNYLLQPVATFAIHSKANQTEKTQPKQSVGSAIVEAIET